MSRIDKSTWKRIAFGDRLAGTPRSVSPGTLRCPTITAETPALNAVANGTMSRDSSVDSGGVGRAHGLWAAGSLLP